VSSLFLVTSALLPDYGCDPSQRLSETLDTFKSIWQRLPDADIWLLEGSISDPSELLKHLPEKVKVIPYWHTQKRKEIAETGFPMGYFKSAMESYMTSEALDNDISKYERIFKISGRYQLTDGFDYTIHNKPSQAVFLHPFYTGLPNAGTNMFLKTCLHSFCPSIKDLMQQTLRTIQAYLFDNWSQGYECDLEHGLYKFLPKDSYVEVGRIGVKGRIGHLTFGVDE
jgi:hypothetical protein